MTPGVVILGAGHAGDGVAAALRQHGWREPICLVGEEPEFPYDRPPLSKAYLKGELNRDRLALRPHGFYEAQDIEVIRNTRAISIDRSKRKVELSSGSVLEYQYMVLATGSKHRTLAVPGADHERVMQLRTLSDANKLMASISPGARFGIIGGGYIGLEAAASLVSLGVTPLVLERESRLLARVASEQLSEFLHHLHVSKGAEILVEAQVEAICAEGASITGIQLAGGRLIACQGVLVGIGALANDDLARQAGLDCDDGVVVNSVCRTSDPDIFAIGDCSRRDMPGFGSSLRLESIPSAQEQAKIAAATITGRAPPPYSVPWFWSDQYEARIQIAGLLRDTARSFRRGDPGRGSFAIYHVDGTDRLRAVEAVGSAAEFMVSKALIKSGVSIPTRYEQASLADLKKALL